MREAASPAEKSAVHTESNALRQEPQRVAFLTRCPAASRALQLSSACCGSWTSGPWICEWSGCGWKRCAKKTSGSGPAPLSVAPPTGRWRWPACGSSPCSRPGRSSTCRACIRAWLSPPFSLKFDCILAWLLLLDDPFAADEAPLRFVQRRLRSCAMDRSLLAPSLCERVRSEAGCSR